MCIMHLRRGGRAWPNAAGLGPVPFVGARVRISPPARLFISGISNRSDYMKLVSACLLGINCNYKGKSKPNQKLIEEFKGGLLYPVCPEVLGRMGVPHPPAEISGGTGLDVINGKAKVMTSDGADVTKKFIDGAFAVLAIAESIGAKEAVLKARSPSCGCGKIYDGTFSDTLIDGDGVTAALLKKNGLKVVTEEEYL